MRKKIIYEEPVMHVIRLEIGDVITWSNQTGAIGGDGTNVDSDDFETMFK